MREEAGWRARVVGDEEEAEFFSPVRRLRRAGAALAEDLTGGVAVLLGNARVVFGFDQEVVRVGLDDNIGLCTVVETGRGDSPSFAD